MPCGAHYQPQASLTAPSHAPPRTYLSKLLKSSAIGSLSALQHLRRCSCRRQGHGRDFQLRHEDMYMQAMVLSRDLAARTGGS